MRISQNAYISPYPLAGKSWGETSKSQISPSIPTMGSELPVLIANGPPKPRAALTGVNARRGEQVWAAGAGRDAQCAHSRVLPFPSSIPPTTPRASTAVLCSLGEAIIDGCYVVTSSVIPGHYRCFLPSEGGVFYPSGPSRPIHLSSDWFDVAWETQLLLSQPAVIQFRFLRRRARSTGMLSDISVCSVTALHS